MWKKPVSRQHAPYSEPCAHTVHRWQGNPGTVLTKNCYEGKVKR